MSIVPTYVIWNQTETAEIFTIPFVQSDNSPQDPAKFVIKDSGRGQGHIIIPGGTKASWDLIIGFVLQGTDYDNLIAQMDAIETTIVKNTKYVIKIGRTVSTTKDYKIKRTNPIDWRDDTNRRRTIQHGIITFDVNSWV